MTVPLALAFLVLSLALVSMQPLAWIAWAICGVALLVSMARSLLRLTAS